MVSMSDKANPEIQTGLQKFPYMVEERTSLMNPDDILAKSMTQSDRLHRTLSRGPSIIQNGYREGMDIIKLNGVELEIYE